MFGLGISCSEAKTIVQAILSEKPEFRYVVGSDAVTLMEARKNMPFFITPFPIFTIFRLGIFCFYILIYLLYLKISVFVMQVVLNRCQNLRINSQKSWLHIDILEIVGIFFFKTSIRATDTTEIRKAVMNIISYDSKEGNDRVEPFIDI